MSRRMWASDGDVGCRMRMLRDVCARCGGASCDVDGVAKDVQRAVTAAKIPNLRPKWS